MLYKTQRGQALQLHIVIAVLKDIFMVIRLQPLSSKENCQSYGLLRNLVNLVELHAWETLELSEKTLGDQISQDDY